MNENVLLAKVDNLSIRFIVIPMTIGDRVR